MTFHISAEAPDGADALRLMAECDAEYAPLYPPEFNFTFSPQELLAVDAAFFVLRESGQALGCGAVVFYDGYAELKRIFVTHDARGRGLAMRIVQHLEAHAATATSLVRLETGEASIGAIPLYVKLGYHRTDPFGDYTESPYSVFMQKSLR